MVSPAAAIEVNLNELERAGLRWTPFVWAATSRALSPATAAEALADGFPEEGFVAGERLEGSKTYRLASRPLLARGAKALHDEGTLSPQWRAFASSLLDASYRARIAALTGVRLDSAQHELTLWRYGADCWLGPHVDKREKLVTQTFYFNCGWDPRWGGALRILRSAAMDDVHAEIHPAPGASVVLVRSPASWHAVCPVHNAPAGVQRLSLTSIFYRARE